MAEKVSDVMTEDPEICDPSATVIDVARRMREKDIGAVIVSGTGDVTGIVTDRDIVLRSVAEERNLPQTQVKDICTKSPVVLSPDDTVDDAVRQMRKEKIRRIPVVKENRPVGIVSLGDLAVDRDRKSVLADISAAQPNN